MNLEYYNLKEQPFGSIPDSRFLFVGSAHRQALGAVLSALQQGNGFVSLVAPPGLGKTSLLFHVFNTLKQDVTTVYIFQAPQTPRDLLRAILVDLGMHDINENPAEMLAILENLLADQVEPQKRMVVIIDEAHHLTPPVLELAWMLSTSASKRGKLLQFVLSGQSQLAQAVAPANGRQLSYRAPIVARLEPLTSDDTALYVDHRVRIAGYDREAPLFTAEANDLIARYSEGVPRKINNLCYSSLSLGYKTKRSKIEGDIVRAVVADLGLDRTLHSHTADTMQPARTLAAETVTRVAPLPFAPPRRTETIVASLPAAAAAPASAAAPFWARPPVTKIPVEAPPEAPAYVFPVAAFPARSQAAIPDQRVAEAERPEAPRILPLAPRPKRGPAIAWLAPKLGLVAAVLIAATVTLVNLHHQAPVPVRRTLVSDVPAASPAASHKAAQPADAKAASPVKKLVPAPAAGAPDLKGMNLQAAIHALSGRSLKTICKENFGNCDSRQLQEMHQVNPRLANPSAKRATAAPAKATATATDGPEKAPLTSRN